MKSCVPFSVVISVYKNDKAENFDLALRSITVEQSIKPQEVVLVVDGPVSAEIDRVIRQYEQMDLNLKVIRFAENQGHGNARRVGTASCTNELVAIMDADDISVSDRFEKQLSVFENDGNLDVVGGNITEFIGDENNVVGKRVVPIKDEEIKSYLKIRCPMNLVTVMFKNTSVQKVGGFIDWYCEEDYYLWIRMAQANMKFANVEDSLVKVRVGKDMYSRRGGIKYFKSEAKLQKYMLNKKIIHLGTYLMNVSKRLIVQVLFPNKLRAWAFKKFARN